MVGPSLNRRPPRPTWRAELRANLTAAENAEWAASSANDGADDVDELRRVVLFPIRRGERFRKTQFAPGGRLLVEALRPDGSTRAERVLLRTDQLPSDSDYEIWVSYDHALTDPAAPSNANVEITIVVREALIQWPEGNPLTGEPL